MHHTDPDGICSGVLMSKVIERLRNKKVDLHYTQKGNEHAIVQKTINILKKNKINKLITTDITSEENAETVKEIEKFAQILIIDHHKIVNTFNSQRITLFKPQLAYEGIEPVKYCTAKLVYDIGSLVTEMDDLDWIASIGVISDIASDQWKEFLEKIFKKYKLKKEKDLFKTLIGKVATVVSNAECYSEKLIPKAYNIIYEAKKPQDILKSELTKYNKSVEDEINYWIKQMPRKAESHKNGEVIYYEIKPKYGVKGNISTIISVKNPNKTFILVDLNNDMISVSGRRSDSKVKINEAMIYACQGIKEASGGGHIPAAGATVPKKDYPKFKEKLLEYLLKK